MSAPFGILFSVYLCYHLHTFTAMRNFVFILLLFCASTVVAQNDLLAQNYFEQGEYEKAISIYRKLYSQYPEKPEYFMKLVEANQQLQHFQKADSLLISKINSSQNYPQLYIELGHNYSIQNQPEKTTQYYKQAIDFIPENPNYAYVIGTTFEKYNLLDEAASVYEKAMKLNPKRDFNVQLARIYGEQGQLEKMFEKYINLIEKRSTLFERLQQNFSLYINEDPTNEANIIFRKTLLKKLQENPDVLYNEMLSWLFIQQKEYKKAFTQEKAIYKRNEENLNRIAELAVITIDEKDYEIAKEVVNFIIENSFTPETKLIGHQYLMNIALKTASPDDYSQIEKQFEALFTEFGLGPQTYLLQIDYNHFLAFQKGEKETAISNLKKLLDEKLSSYQEARIKMELGDILVFDEKFNEALIYYSQIQKKIQNDVISQEARFKVARTSYYKGDFQWAQVQLDVLSKSVSQLIANDAMQLKLMIRDNSLEDSTQTALKKYARADLLALQNRDTEAINALEVIITDHKGEKIEDEALLKQAELFEKTNQYTRAEANYLKLIEFFNEDILADDAHFRLAKLYEEELNQPDKAKEQYEQIIFNFSDSIYFVEARKKFRSLRGDAIN